MIRKNISLKKYNSFNIDVNAEEFVEVNSKDELIEIANKTKDKKYYDEWFDLINKITKQIKS